MVTKRNNIVIIHCACSVLAKILMVTKPFPHTPAITSCSVLAKILMVTKHYSVNFAVFPSSVLAKILMVTKQYIQGRYN